MPGFGKSGIVLMALRRAEAGMIGRIVIPVR
jgi:hypothetical protein